MSNREITESLTIFIKGCEESQIYPSHGPCEGIFDIRRLFSIWQQFHTSFPSLGSLEDEIVSLYCSKNSIDELGDDAQRAFAEISFAWMTWTVMLEHQKK